MSVVFAMLASYFLSRTLVPTMVLYLLAPEARVRHGRDAGHDAPIRRSLFGRISHSFEAGFVKLTRAYEGILDWALEHKHLVIVGTADGEILVGVKQPHRPTAGYLKSLREQLPRRFPDLEVFAQPADIVNQILNFGLPAPIDIQVTGPLAESEKNLRVAHQIAAELRGVPGAVDVHVQQILDAPRIMVDSDRALAQQVGLTQRDVAGSLLISVTSR